jgi:ParB-like chromosome segregation protein Spo0J
MPMSPKEIPLRAMNLKDITFVITYAPDLEPLKDSIARVGIRHPPLVQRISGTAEYRVVSGYKRLRVLKALGIEKVTALLAPPEDDLTLFLLGLHENLGTRPLNLVEKSLALHKLVHQFRLKREEILRDHLPALGLGSDPQALDLYLSISALEEPIKRDLAAGDISISIAHQLSGLPRADRLAFGHLISTLSLGKNLQREFLTLLGNLSRIHKTSLSALLKDGKIISLAGDPKVQRPIRAQRVRELLIRRRYPRFSQAADKFGELKKKLRLSPQLSLTAEPYFEGQDYRLTVTFHSREQLEAAVKALQDLAQNPALARLLEFPAKR